MSVIVSFQTEPSGEAMVSLLRAPFDLPNAGQGRRVMLLELEGGDGKTRGKQLARLIRRCPPVKDVLRHVLQQNDVDEAVVPIYIRFSDEKVDRLPWEELYVLPPGFVALDARWPIARISARVQILKPRVLRLPFRVVAVLSAARDRPGLPQFEALVRAVDEAREASLPTRLHVLTGDKEVFDAATKLGEPHITVEWLAATRSEVIEQIAAAKPAVLHILCHGGVRAAEPGLQVATPRDFRNRAAVGSVYLGVNDVARALGAHESWLVVLAACDSANARTGQSLARALVDAGAPAVIGMRKITDLSATDLLVDKLYPQLFRLVKTASEEDTNDRGLEWAPALTAARQAAAAGVNLSRDLAWSESILYVQDDVLRFSLDSGAKLSPEEIAELRAEKEEWEAFLGRLDPATAPRNLLHDVKAKIQEIDTALAEGIRP